MSHVQPPPASTVRANRPPISTLRSLPLAASAADLCRPYPRLSSQQHSIIFQLTSSVSSLILRTARQLPRIRRISATSCDSIHKRSAAGRNINITDDYNTIMSRARWVKLSWFGIIWFWFAVGLMWIFDWFSLSDWLVAGRHWVIFFINGWKICFGTHPLWLDPDIIVCVG